MIIILTLVDGRLLCLLCIINNFYQGQAGTVRHLEDIGRFQSFIRTLTHQAVYVLVLSNMLMSDHLAITSYQQSAE